MKTVRLKLLIVGLVILFSAGLIAGQVSITWAEDAKGLLTQANKLLRQAKKDMFAGKSDKAVASLDNIKKLISKAQELDPNNSRIKSLKNKYKKLVKDLERRTGKDLGGGALTAAGASAKTKLAPKPSVKAMPTKTTTAQPAAASSAPASPPPTTVPKKVAAPSAKLPYAARKPLSTAKRQLSGLDTLFTDLADPNYRGDKDQLVERIEGRMAGAQKSLDQAKALAAQKGVVSHPEFDKVEADLAEADKKVAQAKGGYSEAKAKASAKSEEVNTDVNTLKAEYDRVSPIFDRATGTVIYYNNLEPVEKLIAEIEDFEKKELANVSQKMEAFAKKYGYTRDEIDKKAESMGYTGNFRASFPYTELTKGIENIKKTRVVMAEDLVKKGNKMLDPGRMSHDFSVVDQYAKVKAWIRMAGRYDSENPKVKEAQDGIDQRVAEGMKAFHAKIDKRTWPKHAANAPKNAEELSGVALEWFKNSKDWGKRSTEPRKPLAVVVTGPWSIQEKNILGEPIMYGLPIRLAVQVDTDKDLNAARVYILTMRTVEKRGVKMEPPFDHITVGNSYFIRPDRVK